MHQRSHRVAVSALPLLVASAGTLVALVAARPDLDPGALAGNGDDLALVSAWACGAACALWLTLTTLACVIALVHGRSGIAMRIAGLGPPMARRLLQTTLVGTFAVMPAAAYATPAAPIVLHVGPGGRLTSLPGDPGNDTPVVRMPPPSTRVTPPAPPATTTPTTTIRPAVTVPAPGPLPTVRASTPGATTRREGSDRARGSRHAVVRPGDNLWTIAAAETARVSGVARPDTRAVAAYWRRVLAANRSTLRSGDPGLIFPGELIRLPDSER